MYEMITALVEPLYVNTHIQIISGTHVTVMSNVWVHMDFLKSLMITQRSWHMSLQSGHKPSYSLLVNYEDVEQIHTRDDDDGDVLAVQNCDKYR
jgi:hypothetical protein